MNRGHRARLPTTESVLERMHAVVRGIQRTSVYGNLDRNQATTELTSVRRNLERLEGQLPDQELKTAISTITALQVEISSSNDIAEHALALPKYENTVPNSVGHGRHKYSIDIQQLKSLVETGFSVKKIANDGLLGGTVHPNTLYQRLKEDGSSVSSKYSNISDEELTAIIREYNHNHPNSGSEEIFAFLKSQGLTVQRRRCRQFLSQVDAVGTANRWTRTVQRRQYSVPMTNSLWHLDTHHSLIRWNIVVNGAIDGKSRLIPYLRAASCNTSQSSAFFFIQGIRKFGVPSRVRADHGTEFSDVERCMTLLRGGNRGSFIKGKSVHNQRIERLWKDVFIKVLYIFYKLFHYLEDHNLLDIDNDKDLFCLQYVYIPRIDKELQEWQVTHNNHRIRTENNSTPRMIWLQSMLSPSSETATAAQQTSADIIDQCVRDFSLECEEDQFSRPRVLSPISPEHLLELQNSIDVKRQSTCHGLDIYRDVTNFVNAHV